MPNNSISRRRFLQSTGAAAIWLPATVKGYTASEMQALYVDGAMQQDIYVQSLHFTGGIPFYGCR
jgi:hypothetical protein